MGFTGCKKEIQESENQLSPADAFTNLSGAFTWNTSRESQLTVTIRIPSLGNANCRVNVYKSLGQSSSFAFYSGAVRQDTPLQVTLTVPTACPSLKIELIGPDGTATSQTIPVASSMEVLFTSFPQMKSTSGYPDADKDGIPDAIDDFPQDPLKAFQYRYPSGDGFTDAPLADPDWATLCFEDLWPAMGDFDMNDLVLNYAWTITTDASHFVSSIEGHFSIKAAGSCAIWKHGFGVELTGLPADEVQLVTGFRVDPGSYIQLDVRGLEKTPAGVVASPAVIIPFDDMTTVIHNPDPGFFNTMPGKFPGTSDRLDVLIEMKSPYAVPDSDIDPGGYNPFLIRNGERSIEIHKVDRAPTEWADPAYFGLSNDASNPAQGIWYRSADKLPWAIDLPMDFFYATEFIAITQAYPDIVPWANTQVSIIPSGT